MCLEKSASNRRNVTADKPEKRINDGGKTAVKLNQNDAQQNLSLGSEVYVSLHWQNSLVFESTK